MSTDGLLVKVEIGLFVWSVAARAVQKLEAGRGSVRLQCGLRSEIAQRAFSAAKMQTGSGSVRLPNDT